MTRKRGNSRGSKMRYWTKEEVEFLTDNWGQSSVPNLSKKLDRTHSAIIQKAKKLKLGPFLEAGGYITLSQLMICLRGSKGSTSTINQWVDKGLPVKSKRIVTQRVRIIYLKDFWEWAEDYRTMIDFSKLDPLILGAEPLWVKEQRRADIEETLYFKKTPWTKSEELKLKTLLESYRYSYRDLSQALKRTEGAIKRKVIDLGIKARPIKAYTHDKWSDEDTDTLIDLYNKGYSPSIISVYIPKSSQACSGKIKSLIKAELLVPISKHTKDIHNNMQL